ncbi:hypothetical protein HYW21_03435 [Candidatus Woesearchaeota archaeon]|nr:hypothetical protein [Candidatus Woesearchaeota archaeon]
MRRQQSLQIIPEYALESYTEKLRREFRAFHLPRPIYSGERTEHNRIVLCNQPAGTLIELQGLDSYLLQVNQETIDVWQGNTCYRCPIEALVSWQSSRTRPMPAINDKGERVHVPVAMVSIIEGVLDREYQGIFPRHAPTREPSVGQNPGRMAYESYSSLRKIVQDS